MSESENLAKLPKWAQRRIGVADMRLREANAKIEALLGKGETNTSVQIGANMRPLPDGALVRFTLGATGLRWIDARVDGERLDVRGTGGIALHPSAANAVIVSLEEK